MQLLEVQCKECGWTSTLEKDQAVLYFHQGCPMCKAKYSIELTEKEREKRTLATVEGTIKVMLKSEGVERTMELIEAVPTDIVKEKFVKVWNSLFESKGLGIKI